jgi:TolB-like protein/class 3 adenylate cyclase
MTPELGQSPTPSRGHRRVAAVMFADMVGYSTRVEQDELRNSDLAQKSVDLFRSLIGDYGGEVANVAGDGILALFENAEQALRFAIQMKTEFRDQAVWGDGDPILFRIGLNIGEVVMTQGNIHGHCVNVASRLQALADPGAIVMTASFRAAVRDDAGLAVQALGARTLKNITEPIEIFAVGQLMGPEAPAVELARAAPARDVSRNPSVAVLALANLSGDAANDHLCEGIAEDIIASLSRFRSLMVIARHSAFLFSLKSQSLRDIARRLGARYLLGGSLRRFGKRLRIAVDLMEAETEAVLWSDRFDVSIDDLFDVQEEITGAVASRLAIQIDFAERKQESQYPRDMRAYGLVLRGQSLIWRHTREANAHSRRLFEEAIDIAPDFGRAYSAVSRTHNLDWRYSWSATPEHSLDTAVELAQRAIQLDRLDARAFAELGFSSLYKKQHDEALADYGRALALNPNDADIIAENADALSYAGQPQSAIELLEKAMLLNPYYPDWYLWCLADAYGAMGRPIDVVATVQRMQSPTEGRRLLAANLAHLGRIEEARAVGRELLKTHPDFSIRRWADRPPYRDRAVLERFIEGLRKAGLPD